ncbi:MAG: glycosyltransferase family 2 protein [archaeon]|nr:glycosyltransferase family 2 protein [archaeon]
MVFIQKKLSLIFACYNEEAIFEKSFKKIMNFFKLTNISYEIIFIDDKSQDNTADLIRKVVKGKPNFKAIFHSKNVGRGGSVSDGFFAATGEIVGYLDIDLEISPCYISDALVEIMQGTDAVCAKRSYDRSIHHIFRDFLHAVYSRFANLLLSLPVSDTNASFKFFNRKKIIPVLKKTIDKHWFWDTEIMKRASISGLSIKEIPVLYIPNTEKKSTVKVFSDTLKFVDRVFWLRKKLYLENKK